MPQGLQVFDAGGAVIVDTNTLAVRLLGIITTVGAGSVTHAGLLTGSPFYFLLAGSGIVPASIPEISFSGDTMMWSAVSGAKIAFGVY